MARMIRCREFCWIVVCFGISMIASGMLSVKGASLSAMVDRLPPLMLSNDGDAIADRLAWSTRRSELRAVLESNVYGRMPPRPDKVSVVTSVRSDRPELLATEERITLSIGSKRTLSLRLALYRPRGDGPFPVIIREEHALGHVEEVRSITERGYLFVEFAREDLDPDRAGVVGPAQAAYPDYDWATLAVWAWGGMRVVDYLESRNDVRLDQIGIVGHSRGGKMALLAGAFDTRFAAVFANGSGAGGAGSFVIEGQKCETLELITREERFGYWFHPRLREFVGREASLPFDQHFLKALVAPRALLCTDARGDLWANPVGTSVTTLAADPAFDLFGVREKNGLHFREGGHDLTRDDWQAMLDFADWHFRGSKPRDSRRFRQTVVPE